MAFPSRRDTPQAPPDFVPAISPNGPVSRPGRRRIPRPKCAREGCENETRRADQKYCSFRCRNIANRELYRNAALRQVAAREKVYPSNSSPELKEAFRLAFQRVPIDDWPQPVAEAYRRYINDRREQKRRAKQGGGD